MENEGYIRLYRKLLDNPIVCKDAEHFSVWVYLLLSATHKEYNVIFKNKQITLKPGQLITGRKAIADKLSINENKVQRILKTFENAHQLEQQTSPQNRLVTILRWNEYQWQRQPFEQQVNNERTTSEQQVNTYNNVLNDNNIYLFNYKERAKSITKFSDKMKYLNQIQKEDDYNKLNPDEEYELRNYILKNMGG